MNTRDIERIKPTATTRTHGFGRGHAGLMVRVRPTGAKAFIQRVKLDGVAINIGLGSFPDVTVAEAKRQARINAAKVAAGEDPRRPREPKRAATPAKRRIENGTATLGDCLAEVVELRRGEWKADGRAKQTRDWLNCPRRHAPELLTRPVAELTAREVLPVIVRVRAKSPAIAAKLRSRLSEAVKWAIVYELREASNPFEDVLAVLPRTASGHEPRRALDYREIPAAFAALRRWTEADDRRASKGLAMQLLMLTATRANEAFHAEWRDIDLDAALWTVPAAKMKAGAKHEIPLSASAIGVLRRAGTSEGWVFPGRRDGRPHAASRASETFKAAGVACDPHGCRSSFRDWCAETGVGREIAEAALAHKVAGVEGRYFRTRLLNQRRGIMEAWGAFLTG